MMGMSPVNILTVNLLCSTVVFGVAAWIFVIPKLPRLKPQTVLPPILLLHSFRHLGLMFLAPGGTFSGMPPQFARPAAFLATCSRRCSRWALCWRWLLTCEQLGCSSGCSTSQAQWT